MNTIKNQFDVISQLRDCQNSLALGFIQQAHLALAEHEKANRTQKCFKPAPLTCDVSSRHKCEGCAHRYDNCTCPWCTFCNTRKFNCTCLECSLCNTRKRNCTCTLCSWCDNRRADGLCSQCVESVPEEDSIFYIAGMTFDVEYLRRGAETACYAISNDEVLLLTRSESVDKEVQCLLYSAGYKHVLPIRYIGIEPVSGRKAYVQKRLERSSIGSSSNWDVPSQLETFERRTCTFRKDSELSDSLKRTFVAMYLAYEELGHGHVRIDLHQGNYAEESGTFYLLDPFFRGR